MRILLVRHGQSIANLDKKLHGTIADHDIPLSDPGQLQTIEAGKFLNKFLNEKLQPVRVKSTESGTDSFIIPKVRVWNSPYRRARQTARNIISQIKPLQFSGTPHFSLDNRENNRLCEQQFGLFDGYDDDEWVNVFPNEGKHYQLCKEHNGEYWARMPLGESKFDVGNRVYSTFGTFHRDREKHNIDTIVVVCHGVTLRLFVQEWLHLCPEWVNIEENPDNCWIRYISENDDVPEGDHDHWIDHGYVFTGTGPELWPKRYTPNSNGKFKICVPECGKEMHNGICVKCKRTSDEIINWDNITTQQRSKILIDLTLRD